MREIVIQAEQPVDAEAIDGVVRAAFVHQPEVGDMVAEVRRSPPYRPGLAMVARSRDIVVGFVMLSGCDLVAEDGTGREVLTLTPLAVLPHNQRRGIVAALVAAALHEADGRGEPLVVLEGSPRYCTPRSRSGLSVIWVRLDNPRTGAVSPHNRGCFTLTTTCGCLRHGGEPETLL